MEKQSTNGNSQNEKLSAEIKKTWDRLTPSEIAYYPGKPNEFFSAVKTKHSVDRPDAEKKIKSIEAANSSASSSNASGPIAKAANA